MPSCRIHTLPYSADPTRYFEKIRQAPGAVLFDSGRPASRRGRYDLLSAWPRARLVPSAGETGSGFLQRLRQAASSLGHIETPGLPFAGGLMGYLSYDFARRLERLPDTTHDDLELPDAQLGLYAWAVITDHQAQTTTLVCHPSLDGRECERLRRLFRTPPSPRSTAFHLAADFTPDLTVSDYRAAIERILAYIQAGDCYQVNFAQRFQAPFQGDPWVAYQALRQVCPTPFAGYQSLDGGGAILSLSPERFLSVTDGQVETRPIKGTRPRGRSAAEDRLYADELRLSAKDRAENLMIVDLLRNDLSRSCRPGSVHVPQLFALESYPNVHHLVSCVRGELAPGKDALDLLAGSFPGGSITGAPKIRAMQIIEELESRRRAIYCGSLLYLDAGGRLDSSIAIRTLLARNGRITCWGGGGIVADSDWQAEYQESITKVRTLLATLRAL
ncbi:aminodeoxychorismate synthase component I [Azotobacter vinelandii]